MLHSQIPVEPALAVGSNSVDSHRRDWDEEVHTYTVHLSPALDSDYCNSDVVALVAGSGRLVDFAVELDKFFLLPHSLLLQNQALNFLQKIVLDWNSSSWTSLLRI